MRTLNTVRVKRAISGIRELGRVDPLVTPRQRGDNWMRIRLKWFRSNPICVSCESYGVIQIAQELDHVVPLCKGGADDESNYQSLCIECHKEKSKDELNK